MKIIEYHIGKEKSYTPGTDESKFIDSLIVELLKLTNDMLRVYLDDETISNIKKQKHSIEIIYEEAKIFNTAFLNEVKINRIFIPLTGDYSLSKDGNSVLIIIGENSYSSAPLTTEGGYNYIEELLEIIK